MQFALLLFAFTAGLLLHPVAASLFKKVVHATRLRRLTAAIRLLESNGYTVGFAKSVNDDDDDWL